MEKTTKTDIKMLDVEFTNNCNINCTICPRNEITRPFGYMTIDTLYILLKRINLFPIQYVCISGFGEPLLHPLFSKFIKKLRREFKGMIQIVTNAAKLTGEIAEAIIESEVNDLIVSYNGPGEKEYEKVMKGMRFNKLEDNINSFINMRKDKKKPALVLQTSMPKAIEHKDKVMKIAVKLGFDKLRIYPFNNRMGYLKDENDNVNNTPLSHRFCFPLLFIAWDGVIYPCSHDIKGRNVLGNILNIEFDKVKKENYSICERCTICDIKDLKSYKIENLFEHVEKPKRKYCDDANPALSNLCP